MKKKFTFPSIKIDNIKKISYLVGRYAFLIIIFLILLSLIFGSWVFYQYVFSAQVQKPSVTDGTSQFKYNKYQEVIKNWQTKQQEDSSTQTYLNPFSPAP